MKMDKIIERNLLASCGRIILLQDNICSEYFMEVNHED